MRSGTFLRLASFVLLLVVLAVGSARPPAVFAQEAPDLEVSVRDLQGAGVVATIIVRDPSGERDFARTTTDTHGLAIVDTLPTSEVRVAVEGRLSDGTPLVQHGDDARGLLVFLEAGTTSVDLRVDLDGAVMPDPATMIAQEGAGFDATMPPAAPLAAPFAMPTTRPAVQPAPPAHASPEVEYHDSATQAPFMDDTTFPVGSFTLAGLLSFGIVSVLALRGRI